MVGTTVSALAYHPLTPPQLRRVINPKHFRV